MEKPKAGYFDHERWDVYQAALVFVILVSDIVEHLPRGKAYLADQLQRAGTSIPLNIAEGAGENAISEKARFYRMAKRSATERPNLNLVNYFFEWLKSSLTKGISPLR